MQFVEALPATVLSWLTTMAAFLGDLPVAWQAFIAAFAAGGVVVGVSILRAPAPGRHVATAAAHGPSDVEDYLRGLRIADDDAQRADWVTPRPRLADAVTATMPVLDERTARLAVDPTLRPAEVAEMVDHVAPGTGSVASVAALDEDTKLRGPLALAELQSAEEAAHEMHEVWELEAMFAGFDAAVAEAAARVDRVQWAAAQWSFYVHDAEGMHCPHCAEAAAEVAEEFEALVELAECTMTGEFTADQRAELDALLSADVHA